MLGGTTVTHTEDSFSGQPGQVGRDRDGPLASNQPGPLPCPVLLPSLADPSGSRDGWGTGPQVGKIVQLPAPSTEV